jgi:DNA-binding phage protein
MMERFRTWHEILMERLSEPEDVIGYLEVSLEEYLDDGDKAFFLKGIKNVIEAQGGILSVSEQADIDPRFLSDVVNNGTMPPFHILSSIFTSFGGVGLINLPPTEIMSNAVSDGALETSGKMGSEPVIAENFTERQLQNIEYWKRLCEHLERRDSCLQRPTANASHYRDLRIGIKGFSLRARQTIKHKEISASLVMRGANAIGHFYALRVQEEEIERDFGDKLEWWARAKSEKRVAFRNQDADPTDEKDWPNQHEWLVDMLEKLYKVFHPRLEKLMIGV